MQPHKWVGRIRLKMIREALGKGKFGSVFMCRSKLTRVGFACKTLPKGEETSHREVEIMQHLSGHPGVVTLQSVYEDGESFHLVMELCSSGRLIDWMTKEGRFSEHKAANIFKDLMMVIQYCHDMGVVHRDIKPENFLLTASGKIKLADFGLTMRIANGHPWMLFYTERTLKPVSVRLKPKHFSGTPSQIPTAMSRLESDGKKRCNKFNTGETEVLRCENLNRESGESEESDDSGLVDVLAAAILHCRISEPKRSRLCVTSSPMREQCSSNLKSSLCKAF